MPCVQPTRVSISYWADLVSELSIARRDCLSVPTIRRPVERKMIGDCTNYAVTTGKRQGLPGVRAWTMLGLVLLEARDGPSYSICCIRKDGLLSGHCNCAGRNGRRRQYDVGRRGTDAGKHSFPHGRQPRRFGHDPHWQAVQAGAR